MSRTRSSLHSRARAIALASAVSIPAITDLTPAAAFVAPPASGSVQTVTAANNRSVISAATANAVELLRAEVFAARITPDLSVQQFVERTAGRDPLMAALRRAEQIGGPRWVDDQTCMVQLELGGDRVAQALVEAARAAGDRSPIPATALERRLADWSARRFAATGTSIRAEAAADVRPTDRAWARVGDEARSQALNAARETAIQQVIGAVRPVALSGDRTVGDMLTRHQVARDSFVEWLRGRPVTDVKFGEDLDVELKLAAPADEVFDAMLAACRNVDANFPPEQELTAARDEFRRRVSGATTTGRAKVQVLEAPQPQNVVAAIPAQPPAWVFHQLDAEARATFTTSRLRTKQAAEDKATEALRQRLLGMPMSGSTTVGDAVERMPVVREAVDRTMTSVRVYRVDYDESDGSVAVKVTLDPRDFWRQLPRP